MCSADSNWENRFLGWFPTLKIQMSEKLFQLGAIKYHQFATLFESTQGGIHAAHGRSPGRKLAAVKCAAETIERKFMLQFFHEQTEDVQAEPIDFLTGKIAGNAKSFELPPGKSLRTSNGWAVHQTKEKALESARMEALERHLLLKSYLTNAWEGFRLVRKMDARDSAMKLYFLVSNFSAGQYIAGMVVAQSDGQAGISCGYCVGRIEQIEGSAFWEVALLEAVDKILALEGEEPNSDILSKSWLRSGTEDLLRQPFDCEVFKDSGAAKEEGVLIAYTCTFDLSEIFETEFPFYAAYVWGGDALPLFDKKSLEPCAESYLCQILDRNGLSLKSLPDRQPIL